MENANCIRTRRSVRKFTAEPISCDTMDRILDLARWAPSWKNSQTARYTIVKSPELKAKIAAEGTMGFTFNEKTISRCASLVVMSAVTGICGYEADGSFTTDKGDSWEMFDAGVAAQTFCLAAHEHGVGTVILGIYDGDKIADMISLPENERITCLIACGYPEKEGNPPARHGIHEIARYL